MTHFLQAALNIDAPDEDADSKPDYNFKFNARAKELLSVDTEGIAAKAKAPASVTVCP